MAKELSYGAVIEALEKGDFYASTGPEIRELSFEGREVLLRCSNARQILVYFTVLTADGKSAHTRAFTREELGI